MANSAKVCGIDLFWAEPSTPSLQAGRGQEQRIGGLFIQAKDGCYELQSRPLAVPLPDEVGTAKGRNP